MNQAEKWDLNQAIRFIHNHKQIDDIKRAENVFTKQIKETESEEQRAVTYYYLLRCKLMKHAIFETPECNRLYYEMIQLFRKVEKSYFQEYRDKPDDISSCQMEVFYKMIEHYLGSLKKIYNQKNFLEPATKAHIDMMNFRKDRFWFKKDYVKYGTYTLFDLTSKYGNSMGRWLFTSFLTMFIFGFLFFLIDLFYYWAPMIDLSTDNKTMFDYFYYSIITFATLGYGDITPVVIIGEILASIEVMVGYLMLGMLINLLGKNFN